MLTQLDKLTHNHPLFLSTQLNQCPHRTNIPAAATISEKRKGKG
jgi:hypothetical protein